MEEAAEEDGMDLSNEESDAEDEDMIEETLNEMEETNETYSQVSRQTNAKIMRNESDEDGSSEEEESGSEEESEDDVEEDIDNIEEEIDQLYEKVKQQDKEKEIKKGNSSTIADDVIVKQGKEMVSKGRKSYKTMIIEALVENRRLTLDEMKRWIRSKYPEVDNSGYSDYSSLDTKIYYELQFSDFFTKTSDGHWILSKDKDKEPENLSTSVVETTKSPAAEMCVICGGSTYWSSRHYFGVLSCVGCRNFFAASMTLEQDYKCRRTCRLCRGDCKCKIKNNCTVSLISIPRRCKYCWLQRCLEMGMSMDEETDLQDQKPNNQEPSESSEFVDCGTEKYIIDEEYAEDAQLPTRESEEEREQAKPAEAQDVEFQDKSLEKVYFLLKPLCKEHKMEIEKKTTCHDKTDFLELFNPMFTKHLRYFPTIHLILFINQGNLHFKIFFRQKEVLKETLLQNIQAKLLTPSETFYEYARAEVENNIVESFLSLLPFFTKYKVCQGASKEDDYQGEAATINLKSVLIEREGPTIIYRHRQCSRLSETESKCRPCSELHSQLTEKQHSRENLEGFREKMTRKIQEAEGFKEKMTRKIQEAFKDQDGQEVPDSTNNIVNFPQEEKRLNNVQDEEIEKLYKAVRRNKEIKTKYPIRINGQTDTRKLSPEKTPINYRMLLINAFMAQNGSVMKNANNVKSTFTSGRLSLEDIMANIDKTNPGLLNDKTRGKVKSCLRNQLTHNSIFKKWGSQYWILDHFYDPEVGYKAMTDRDNSPRVEANKNFTRHMTNNDKTKWIAKGKAAMDMDYKKIIIETLSSHKPGTKLSAEEIIQSIGRKHPEVIYWTGFEKEIRSVLKLNDIFVMEDGDWKMKQISPNKTFYKNIGESQRKELIASEKTNDENNTLKIEGLKGVKGPSHKREVWRFDLEEREKELKALKKISVLPHTDVAQKKSSQTVLNSSTQIPSSGSSVSPQQMISFQNQNIFQDHAYAAAKSSQSKINEPMNINSVFNDSIKTKPENCQQQKSVTVSPGNHQQAVMHPKPAFISPLSPYTKMFPGEKVVQMMNGQNIVANPAKLVKVGTSRGYASTLKQQRKVLMMNGKKFLLDPSLGGKM